jgi:predicted MFS family arabinose efflux permease
LALIVLVVVLARHPPQSAGPAAAIGIAELKAVWRIDLTRTLAALAFVGVGVFVAMSTYLQPILHHNHISSTAAGLMLAGMLLAGVIGCGAFPPPVAKRNAARTYLMFAVTWVGACCILLSVLHPVAAADFVLVPLIGLMLLASLPVMLELIEREMGAVGGVATGILLLAGNGGGLIVAVVVSLFTGIGWIAFLILAAVALSGLLAARRVAPAPV